jgi:hypothetical protein
MTAAPISVNGTVAACDSQRRGIHNEIGEPEAHGLSLAEDALEDWLHCSKIKQRLIDVEDDQGKIGHVISLRFAKSLLEGAFIPARWASTAP